MSTVNKVELVRSGSYEHLRTSAGRCFFFRPADDLDAIDAYLKEHKSEFYWGE